MGALEKRQVVEEREAWRLLTCMWLHGGVIHLVTNMLSLLFIGIRLEQEFGFCEKLNEAVFFRFHAIFITSFLTCTPLLSWICFGSQNRNLVCALWFWWKLDVLSQSPSI